MSAGSYEETVADLGTRLRSGKVSAVELVEELASRVEVDNGSVHAVSEMFLAVAREEAKERDAELRAGEVRGPLHGIPVLVKDNILTREARSHAGSSAPLRFGGPARDAHVVTALRMAGAVVLGKTRMSELAIGVPTGPAAWREPRTQPGGSAWAGGSSSGSAAAVASGFAPLALGTDTGGSIRIPAAFCGVTGFKPSFGTISIDGVIPLAPTLDTVGPLARTAEDCRLAMAAILAGPSGTSLAEAPRADLAGVRVAIDPLADQFGGGPDPLLADRLLAVGDVLRSLGATVIDRALPRFEELSDAALILLLAEAVECHSDDLRLHWDRFGEPARHRVLSGAVVDARAMGAAQRIRDRAMTDIEGMFRDVDLVISPTTGREAPLIADLSEGRADDLRLLYTRYWNAARCPVLSVPVGSGITGRPLGIQIAAALGADRLCLEVGEAIQRVTDWHRRRVTTDRGLVAGGQEAPAVRPARAPSTPAASTAATRDPQPVHVQGAERLRERGFPILEGEVHRLALHLQDVQVTIDRLGTAARIAEQPRPDQIARPRRNGNDDHDSNS